MSPLTRDPRRERADAERGFVRTLCYGALAALALPVSVLVLAPRIGTQSALAIHLIVALAGYLVVLARGARPRVAVGAAAVFFGLVAWWLAGSTLSLLALLSLGVAFARSGVLFDRRPLRALLLEMIVTIGALSVVGLIASPGLLGNALALWGWFVVQSFYFLLGGLARRRSASRGDAFETARSRLEDLLAD